MMDVDKTKAEDKKGRRGQVDGDEGGGDDKRGDDRDEQEGQGYK
jgi:hypothetical protein